MAKLTNSSEETSIADLFSAGNSLFIIPFFQREYRWKPENVRNLFDDILNVVDGSTDKHFLGAIIIHGRRSNPTDPKVYEVIDGQQRLTTIFLFLAALIKTLCRHKEFDEAASIAQNFLLSGRSLNGGNVRIQPCRLDRTMMNFVVEELRSEPEFLKLLSPFEMNSLASYGANKGPFRNNYLQFKRLFSEEFKQGGIDRVREIYTAFLQHFTLVQIDVLDPTDGPKIFDSLNSKQEPMKIGDLVRNEVFRKISNEAPEKIERIDESDWQPFYASFEYQGVNHFDKYFFPYGIIFDPNLKKSGVFLFLRERWSGIDDPRDIISELKSYQAPFMDLICATNSSGFDKPLHKRFLRLTSLGAPSSVYPFFMQLGHAVMHEKVLAEVAAEICDRIESFLVRRAICGYEPTGLHAVFKRLWGDVKDNLSPDNVSREVSSKSTVTWPGDDEFRSAILGRPLYGAKITPFVLHQFDESLGGDAFEKIDTIEHVLPQRPTDDWKATYGESFVEKHKDALANLVPCSSAMNSQIGNQPYELKRARFSTDSKFKTTRAFATTNAVWDHAAFERRAEELAAWGLERWPHGRLT